MYNARKSFVISDFSFGWDISQSPLGLDTRALSDCKNFNLTTKRGLEKRRGMTKLYLDAVPGGTSVQDLYEYKAPNGTVYVLAATGTGIKSYHSGAWNDLKTGLTAGLRYSFVTHQGFCYGVNGVDANFKLYNTTAYGVGIFPPAAAPVVTDGGAGSLTGKYSYVYCYKRSTPNPFTGNPSSASVALDLTSRQFNVAYTASADPQVDKINIYRTLNLNTPGTDPTAYFLVAEVANATASYNDQTEDADLTTELEIDNTAPPKAKFLVLHKDRVVYLNCPDEANGGSLARWSKAGIGDATPSANYQYLDRRDGEDITGGASVGESLVVFKRNRIFVITGDLADPTSVGAYKAVPGIGCIAPWAILPFEDKVIFLSEEGWKSFDGENLYDLSQTIQPLVDQGYVASGQAANYSAAYYPARHQFIYLCNHSYLDKRMLAGHFLVPLLYINKGIPEQMSQNIVGWTYHEYPHHTLTCIGTYTDDHGITRLIGGSHDGYVYRLDSGNSDDGYNIPYSIQTGWLPLGESPGVFKTIRLGFISMSADQDCSFMFQVESDFNSPFYTTNLELIEPAAFYCGYAYCGYSYLGMRAGFTVRVPIPGKPGQIYRFGISGDDQVGLTIQAMTFMFRVEGVR